MRNPNKLSVFSVLVFLLGMAIMIVCVLHKTQGHFIYALDDPYIHLALSEQLAHGHYGINPQEPASPSSSILWPFLLIPLAGTSLHAFVPLAWNLLFGSLAAALIGLLVSTWPLTAQPDGEPVLSRYHFLLTALLLLTANLFSLSIIGMEHVLQVLLAIACAWAIIQALHHRPIPAWSLAAAFLAPAVRYEDLALTLAVAIACAALGRRRTGLILFASSLLPLALFSVFLKSRAMPLLPVSVMVKGDVYAKAGRMPNGVHLLAHNLKADLLVAERWPVVLITAFFLFLVVRVAPSPRRVVYSGVALMGVLQLTVGRFGWFHRYEDYALIFLMLVGLATVIELYRPPAILLTAAVFSASLLYGYATIITPYASQAIYLQQFQMHRFLTGYYKGDFAVNDLGLTSFQRTPGTYVLDLFGLASVEAAKQKNKDARWMVDIVARHHIDLVMIYPYWFKVPGPDLWKPIGSLCETPHGGVLLGDHCVVFYSTRRASDQAIAEELGRFSKTLPTLSTYTPLP